jgi:hypothetical protein
VRVSSYFPEEERIFHPAHGCPVRNLDPGGRFLVLRCIITSGIKGTVQRKLRGVVSDSRGKDFLSLLTADILFLNLNGTGSLNFKKTSFSGLSKNMWLIHFNGAPPANN